MCAIQPAGPRYRLLKVVPIAWGMRNQLPPPVSLEKMWVVSLLDSLRASFGPWPRLSRVPSSAGKTVGGGCGALSLWADEVCEIASPLSALTHEDPSDAMIRKPQGGCLQTPVDETEDDEQVSGNWSATSTCSSPTTDWPRHEGTPCSSAWSESNGSNLELPRRRPNATPRLEPQIVVCAGPAQDQITGLPLVDQDPVRFHMAIPPTLPIAFQAMISVPRVQGTNDGTATG